MQADQENLSQQAAFQYVWDRPCYVHERPYHIFDEDLPKGVKRGNLDIRFGPEQLVEDVRHSSERFDLDVQGFVFQTDSLTELDIDFTKRDDIEQKYIPSVKTLITNVLGGDVAHCEAICWRVSRFMLLFVFYL